MNGLPIVNGDGTFEIPCPGHHHNVIVWSIFEWTTRIGTDRQKDGQTERWTDNRTDASAWAQSPWSQSLMTLLKMVFIHLNWFICC